MNLSHNIINPHMIQTTINTGIDNVNNTISIIENTIAIIIVPMTPTSIAKKSQIVTPSPPHTSYSYSTKRLQQLQPNQQ